MRTIDLPPLAAELDRLAQAFDAAAGWEDRYRLVLAMADELQPLPLDALTERARVAGCASQVWLVITPLMGGRLAFTGESDARLVRGLIAILARLLSGRTRDEIELFDAAMAFQRLGLSQAMSAQRANGLRAMVARLKREAAAGCGREGQVALLA